MDSRNSLPLIIGLVFALTSFAEAEVRVIEGMKRPFSIVFESEDVAYGVEFLESNRVFKLNPESGELTFIAGQAEVTTSKMGDIAEGDGGPASEGRFNGMHDLTLSSKGDLYLADTFTNRVRKIPLSTMLLETLAGGGKGAFQDGPLAEATFNGPFTVDLSADGTRILVADLSNRRVREINLESGTVRTVAGNGKRGQPQDGAAATKAPLVSPRAAIYGADGSIYIASREGNALRHIDLDGKIRTLVNTEGSKGYSGDGGPGLTAQLAGPKHLCLDPDGNIVIADDQNACIRLYKVDDGTVHLLAGMPEKPGTTVGQGRIDTQLNRPHGARYDTQGRLWVCDSWNDRLLCFEDWSR